MHKFLAGFPVVVELPVAWGDMDAYQHVNNTVYFRFCECARFEYLARIGFTDSKEETGIGPILASAYCRFRSALIYPDRVLVGTRISDIGADRFTMEYRIVSLTTNKVAAEGDSLIVAFDYHRNRKTALPSVVLARIEALQQQ